MNTVWHTDIRVLTHRARESALRNFEWIWIQWSCCPSTPRLFLRGILYNVPGTGDRGMGYEYNVPQSRSRSPHFEPAILFNVHRYTPVQNITVP